MKGHLETSRLVIVVRILFDLIYKEYKLIRIIFPQLATMESMALTVQKFANVRMTHLVIT